MRQVLLFSIVVFAIVSIFVFMWVFPAHALVNNGVGRIMVHKEFRKTPSLLFMIASYSFEQFLALQRTLDCLRDICNAGWDVTIHLQVGPNSINYDHPIWPIINDRMFCVRKMEQVPIVIEEFESIGFGLNSKHRAFAASHIHEFDYISYAEEDMLLTVSHLETFVSAVHRIQKALPDTWMRYQIGFLRW